MTMFFETLYKKVFPSGRERRTIPFFWGAIAHEFSLFFPTQFFNFFFMCSEYINAAFLIL
jgi:hypothetical protein